MTPYEALCGERPDVSYLVAIGTKAFIHITKKKTHKLAPRNFEGIMVGYGGSHQYRIWIPGTNKIKVSRDVRFVGEGTRNMVRVGAHDMGLCTDAAPHGRDDAEAHGGAQRKERIIYDTIEVLPPPRNESVSESESEIDSEDGEPSESDDGDGDGGESDNEISRAPTIETEPFVSAPSSPKDPVPEIPSQRVRKPKPPPYDPASYVSSQDEAAKLEAAKPEAAKRKAQSHVSYAFKTTTTMWSESGQIEPQSYEAVNHPVYAKEWIMATQEEYESLMKNGAWELVELPPGKNLVTCKWVFKAKHDTNGNIVRFKARLVARGFSQAYEIDYFETYAPVAKLTTYRVIFALAALEQWEIHGMDVITAYLLGLLDEEIYMIQPEGFVKTGMKRILVCRVLRSLYGLKQAARVWNQKIHTFLIKIGFVRSSADPCLYIDTKRNIYITIWVDDLLIAGKNGRDIAAVKVQLAGEFEMKDLGELKHFLGMRITRTSGGISIDQGGYVRQVLERYGMSNSKPVSTPLAPGARLAKAMEAGDVDAKLYQGIVGSIMYGMLCTRPDLAFPIQQLSQFGSNPANMHFQA